MNFVLFSMLRKLRHFCDTAEYAAALRTNKELKRCIGKRVTVVSSVLHLTRFTVSSWYPGCHIAQILTDSWLVTKTYSKVVFTQLHPLPPASLQVASRLTTLLPVWLPVKGNGKKPTQGLIKSRSNPLKVNYLLKITEQLRSYPSSNRIALQGPERGKSISIFLYSLNL